MIASILTTIMLLLLLAILGVIVVAVAIGFILRRSRSIVPPGVRRRLNRDLENALEQEQLDAIKRKWMKADGWEVDEA